MDGEVLNKQITVGFLGLLTSAGYQAALAHLQSFSISLGLV